MRDRPRPADCVVHVLKDLVVRLDIAKAADDMAEWMKDTGILDRHGTTRSALATAEAIIEEMQKSGQRRGNRQNGL